MYLTFYDFLRNPDVPVKDVIYRHFKLGGYFMAYQGDAGKESARSVELAREKAEMIPLVYRYIQENQKKSFPVTWTKWKKQFEK